MNTIDIDNMKNTKLILVDNITSFQKKTLLSIFDNM